MKALIGSFLLFLLLVGGVLLNSRYTLSLGEDLLSILSEIPDYTEAGAERDPFRASEIEALKERWETARAAVSVTVHSRIEGDIDEAISHLKTALYHGEKAEFDHARSRLFLLLEELMRHEKFDPKSIV